MSSNPDRLLRNLMDLGSIGYRENHGTNRMAYSEDFFKGRDFVKKLMEEVGMETSIDGVGNLTGFLPATDSKETQKKKIVMASHIDTVPDGGMYDGALGVMGAIEVIRLLKESGYENQHPIEVIAFNEEEGNVVGGTFGSKAFAGSKLEESMRLPMKSVGITETDFYGCKRDPKEYLAYIELHIEQGGVLESKQQEIGVVDGIFGILRYRAKMQGLANHAGSTPMYLRDDAMSKTAVFISELMHLVKSTNDTMVCTIGTMKLHPGAVNVIPGEAEFIIELRDKTMKSMYEVMDQLRVEWERKGLILEEYITQPETVCDERLASLVEQAAEEKGYSYMHMYSGAGHDLINTAMIMPGILIFIPSRNGLSHHKDEYSSPEELAAGVDVLMETLKKIDNGGFGYED